MLAEFIDPAVLGFILKGVKLFSKLVGCPISYTLILLATLYAAYTTIRCWIDPSLGPVLPEEMRAASMKEV